jgi:hypothetical protein
MSDPTYHGHCFCGAVCITARGAPLMAGYCHCQDCRDWSNAPVTSFTLWPFAAVAITQGRDKLVMRGRIPETPRAWCAVCGGHVGAFREHYDPPHAALGPHMLSDYPFAPTMHLFCREAVLAIDDDLPRFRDLPEGFAIPGMSTFGSGELMPGSPRPHE